MRRGTSIKNTLGLALAVLWLPSLAAETSVEAPARTSAVPGLPGLRTPAVGVAPVRPPGVPDDAALRLAGARIGQVHIRRGEIFDTSLPEENTAIFRFANWLHVQTREETVRMQLLFKPGDPYDARLLRESERILRANPYLREAFIRPVTYADGTVDLEVNTADVWTLDPGLSFGRKGGTNSTGFGLDDANFLGLGSQVGLAYEKAVDRSATTLSFRDRHVAGSWWDLSTLYADNSDGRSMAFGLERPFYALDTRWSAGVTWRDEERIDSLYEGGEVTNQLRARERVAKIHAGWSAGLQGRWVTRWTAGLGFAEYQASPVQPSPGGIGADSRKFVYPWVGAEWVEDEFRETRNQDQIGKTEDVPLGWHIKAELGFAATGLGSDRHAGLFDVTVSKGWEPTSQQTLLMTSAAKGRVESHGLAGSLFSATGRYYLRQTPRRSLFLAISADRGVHLDRDQQLLLGGDNGLRGYPLRYQGGKGRWVFTAEQRLYTDWYVWRLFRVGGAVFYDMGQAWGNTAASPVSTGLLRDVGFGLRFGNSRTALGHVVHVDVAFPLDGDPSISRAQLIVGAKETF